MILRSNSVRYAILFWTAAFAAVLFLVCAFAYHGPAALRDLSYCIYNKADCSAAVGTWALAGISSFALVAAASAYFLEVEPILTCRLMADEGNREVPSDVRVYVTAQDDNSFTILTGEQPMSFDASRYGVARCCFSNAGRSPLLGLSAVLEVMRINRVQRPDSWDGLPVETVERRETRRDIPLDHLTAADNEYRRTIFVTVYCDLVLATDTMVRWTGSATCSGRRFWFRPPQPLMFETVERPLDSVNVPGGGGF